MTSKPLLWAVAVALFLPLPATAQANRRDPDGCVEAAAALGSRPVGQAYYQLLQTLASCPTAGPGALAQEWEGAAPDSVGVRLLGDVTASLRDRRLLVAVRTVALSSAPPRAVRLAAIRVMISYFDPTISLHFREPFDPNYPGSTYVMVGSWAHPFGQDGAEPLPASVRSDVLATLGDLGSRDQDDTVVVKVAAYLAKRLR